MSNKITLGISLLFALMLATGGNLDRWFLIVTGVLYAIKSVQIYLYQSKEDQDD
jgi:hypothetical protein